MSDGKGKGRAASAPSLSTGSREAGGDVAELRARLCWTQAQMAEALGMSVKGYQELERGKRFGGVSVVSPDRRTRLALSAIAFGLKPWPTEQRIVRRFAVGALTKER